jgi:hypothetical protein
MTRGFVPCTRDIVRKEKHMSKWCMEHPWMTFFIFLMMIESTQAIIKYLTGWHKTDKEVELEILKEEMQNK